MPRHTKGSESNVRNGLPTSRTVGEGRHSRGLEGESNYFELREPREGFEKRGLIGLFCGDSSIDKEETSRCRASPLSPWTLTPLYTSHLPLMTHSNTPIESTTQ